MAPVRVPEESSDEDMLSSPWGYNRGKPTPREIIAKLEGPNFAFPLCDLLAN